MCGVDLQARIADPRLASSSKYDGLTTDRLLALRDSRFQDLLRGSWQGDDGRAALRLITDLAGLLEAPQSTILDTKVIQDAEIGANMAAIPADSRPQVRIYPTRPLMDAALHPSSRLHLAFVSPPAAGRL